MACIHTLNKATMHVVCASDALLTRGCPYPCSKWRVEVHLLDLLYSYLPGWCTIFINNRIWANEAILCQTNNRYHVYSSHVISSYIYEGQVTSRKMTFSFRFGAVARVIAHPHANFIVSRTLPVRSNATIILPHPFRSGLGPPLSTPIPLLHGLTTKLRAHLGLINRR